VDVTTFSFIFKEAGIYVFENAASKTITIIGVQKESQQCSEAINGISANMITKESLADIGIKAQDKQIRPDWWFISFSFLGINTICFFVLGLFMYTYNLNVEQAVDLSKKKDRLNTIYYDKINEMEDH